MARRGENIYKRKDGRYEGRYIKYYDTNGKAVYGYVYARNYADIKEKLKSHLFRGGSLYFPRVSRNATPHTPVFPTNR